jgi:hypothetical protein
MAYVDPQFQVPTQDTVAGSVDSGVALSTITASGTQTFTGTAGTRATGTLQFPVFKTPTRIISIRVYNVGAAATITGGLVMNFLNGTSTLGSCTAPGTATFTDCTLAALSTDSHGVVTGPTLFTSTNGEVTNVNVAIGTASAQTLGTYAVDFVTQNLFVS